MIDHPEQVERLLAKLEAALPIATRVTPELQARLREGDHPIDVPANGRITWVSYAGDEGGIVCRIDFGQTTSNAVFASITHLRFDPRLPLTREITAYQKHRVKRLQRQTP
jgi:hypothetical protein